MLYYLMSKIGSKYIKIKKSWSCEILNKRTLYLKINNISENFSLPKPFYLKLESNFVYVKNSETNECKKSNVLWGTYRAKLNNFLIGKSKGFCKKIEILGVGFNVKKKNQFLEFELGFSHKIFLKIPSSIFIKIEEEKIIILKSENKQKLGNFCYIIKNLKKRNPYKKKGLFEIGEKFTLKQKKKK